MRIHMAQLNPLIGDFRGNLDKHLEVLKTHGGHVDMVVFPELSLCGYYPEDFLERASFLKMHDEALQELLAFSAHCPAAIVVGVVEKNDGPGKPLFNSLFLMNRGRKVLSYRKRLLPTYNIFDERRHFEPGTQAATWDFQNERIGFLICEDGWNDEATNYEENPVKDAVHAGATILVSINASPSHVGKPQSREAMFCKMAAKYEVPLVYVNQVGTQDSIGFDGHSFAVSSQGVVRCRLKGFEEDGVSMEVKAGQVNPCLDLYKLPIARLPDGSDEFFYRQIVMGIQDYTRKCGFQKVVVGSSGGIDSALVLALAVDAVGAENVVSIGMPSGHSSSGSVDDARELAENMGIEYLLDPIADEFSAFVKSFAALGKGDLTGLARQNVQARIRGTKLMEFSNQFGHLLLTTGNKSETSVGYCTLYGDTNGGLNPIGDLYKTEVQSLCRWINMMKGNPWIPQNILTKAPSAELEPGQKDEDNLPAYPVLDAMLRYHLEPLSHLQEYLNEDELFKITNLVLTMDPAVREWVVSAVARAEYKRRQAPPILRVHARAFGVGRRVPISHGFAGGLE